MSTPQSRPGGQPDSAGPVDIGLAERVEFAWHRTGLSIAGIGVAILGRTLPQVPARPIVGVILLCIGGAFTLAAVVARARTRRLAPSRRAQMRLIAFGAVAIGLVVLAVSVFP
jgi:uncharacterized membrane protein YidH (DUF202 family)